jgi:putative iron-regulated protein
VAASYGTESDENLYYVANVVAHPKLSASGATIDASTIDAKLLQQLHEIDAIEANVATGYHAVEFLLWGQDLNGTGPGAGVRRGPTSSPRGAPATTASAGAPI